MILIVLKYLNHRRIKGLTVFPFIFISHKEDKKDRILINHEKIHIRQQLELLIIPFFIWYGIEFLLRLIHYKKISVAYRNICFEREAYTLRLGKRSWRTRRRPRRISGFSSRFCDAADGRGQRPARRAVQRHDGRDCLRKSRREYADLGFVASQESFKIAQ